MIRGRRIRAALESYAPRELLFPASLGALIKSQSDRQSPNSAVAASEMALNLAFPRTSMVSLRR